MPIGLSVALALAAQAVSGAPAPAAGPEAATAAPADKPASPRAADGCQRTWPNAETLEIVVCAERPKGYRIDPDLLAVKKMKRSGGRPSRPNAAGVRDTSACAVGPQGCPSAGINLIAAALTAAEMASRLAKGQEIGSMFITDPQPSEYQLYVAAKAAREAKEAEKAAKAKAAQKRAGEAARAATPPAAAQPSR